MRVSSFYFHTRNHEKQKKVILWSRLNTLAQSWKKPIQVRNEIDFCMLLFYYFEFHFWYDGVFHLFYFFDLQSIYFARTQTVEFQVHQTHIIRYLAGVLAPSSQCSILIEILLAGKPGQENNLSKTSMGTTNSKFEMRSK